MFGRWDSTARNYPQVARAHRADIAGPDVALVLRTGFANDEIRQSTEIFQAIAGDQGEQSFAFGRGFDLEIERERRDEVEGIQRERNFEQRVRHGLVEISAPLLIWEEGSGAGAGSISAQADAPAGA